MAEEVKSPMPTPPDGEKKPSAEKTAASSEKAAASSGETPAPSQSANAESAKPAARSAQASPAQPAASSSPAPAKAAAPAKPAGPVPQPWSSPLVEKYKHRYGSGLEALSYLGQNYFVADRSFVATFLLLLRDDEQFDYCVDVTAAHYPKREKQFDVIWILYSFARNERVRVKTQIADGESVSSVAAIWATANWLEREVYDMFGIKFEGHPELKRILLPEDWQGYPLRKDYGILQQDKQWVQINLGIESGQ